VSPERIQRTGEAHGGSDMILVMLNDSPETHQKGCSTLKLNLQCPEPCRSASSFSAQSLTRRTLTRSESRIGICFIGFTVPSIFLIPSILDQVGLTIGGL